MTLADALRPNLPALPFALVNPDAVRSIMEACACLPDALASEYGFECRLREGDDDVDLAIAVQHNGGGRAILAGADPHLALPVEMWRHTGWAAVATFCRAWQDVGSPFHTTVSSIWLELDGAVSGLAAPGVFIGLRSPDTHLALEALTLLRGSVPPTGLISTLQATCNGTGDLFQIGIFPGRSIDAIRVCLHMRSPGDILPLLEGLSWHGNRDELKEALVLLAPIVERIDLDLDVLPGDIAPRVGIEAHFGRRQPSREPAWRLVFQGLVEAGLCAPEKRDAALGFAGYSTERLIYERVYIRGLHHLKVVAGAGMLDAKLYMGLVHRPRSAFATVPA